MKHSEPQPIFRAKTKTLNIKTRPFRPNPNRYAEFFEIFYRKRDKIDRVTIWGIHDAMSWKNNYPIPGRTNYTLLWDRALQPKPALEAVLQVPAQAK